MSMNISDEWRAGKKSAKAIEQFNDSEWEWE